jgi:hypothetical protein
MIKDLMGNELHEGDWITLTPRSDVLWIGQVAEIKEPRLIAANPTQQGGTMFTVRIIMDITMTSPIPAMANITRIVKPVEEKGGPSLVPPKPS